ncbi:hypothetical protein C9374_003199 [Naegleria lovaniensis]|uniref:Uncharacterized protein n=1 Tax=Naegleria lovaniensis TaxID=51637 RepID=A0AA88KJV6_NAELO|nr:uncharacterized protein C9374_003199 [Naegleria lovaniensis]KAG2386050.1 hypothetical protein C9374_003199 [Naegleria lovaniensis]
MSTTNLPIDQYVDFVIRTPTSSMLQNFEIPSSPVNMTTTTNTRQSCSCPNCGCNGESPCPKTISANRWTVLASIECSGQQTAGIGLVNIQAADSSGFQYFLVDSANKDKALNSQPFSYSKYKSSPNQDQYASCVSDGKPSYRPFPDSVGAYMMVKSNNLITNALLRFNVQLSCVISPANVMRVQTSSTRQFSRHYVGYPSTFAFSFLNKYQDVDTWQEGVVSMTSVNSLQTGSIRAGVGSIQYTPTSVGPMQMKLKYTPSPSVYGSWQDLDSSIQVYQMATKGRINLQLKTDHLSPLEPFTVGYIVFDNDGVVTEVLDWSKFKITANYEEHGAKGNAISCSPPNTLHGEGVVSCNCSDVVGTFSVVASFDGKVLDSKEVTILEDEVLIFWLTPSQWAVILVICIAGCMLVLGVAAGIVAVVRFMRNRAKKDMVKLEDPVEKEEGDHVDEQPFRNANN